MKKKTSCRVCPVFLILLLMLSSCENDFLSVENPNAITEGTYYRTAEHAYAGMIGSYSRLKSWDLYGLRYFRMWPVWSDLGKWENNLKLKLMDVTEGEQLQDMIKTYENLYIGLYRANKTIKMLDPDENPDMNIDPDLRLQYLRELHTLRAFYNFLLTLFYNEPPLLTEPIEDPSFVFTNASRAEFYAQIIEDLTFAVGEGEAEATLIPMIHSPSEVGRITRGTALALLGKVYLYKASYAPEEDGAADYQKARDYFRKVIDLGVYDLIFANGTSRKDTIDAFLTNFTKNGLAGHMGDNNMESVFEIQYGKNVKAEAWESGFEAEGHRNTPYFAPSGWANLAPTQKFLDFFDEGDPRYNATFYELGDTILKEDGTYRIFSRANLTKNQSIEVGWKKYWYPEGNVANGSFGENNIKVIRYSDVLLMLAECDLALGITNDNSPETGGLWALNYVRARSNMPPRTELSFDYLEQERVCELGFEGFRFHDLVRWNLNSRKWVPGVSAQIQGKSYKAGRNEFMPIPSTELTRNPGLKQNPGYN